MSWDPQDCPESGTEKEYCNKRALKGTPSIRKKVSLEAKNVSGKK
jgi:hypothetical protein